MANRWGNNGNSDRLYLGGLQNHYRLWLKPWNYKTLALLRNIYDQPRQHIKKQRHYFANSGPSSQSYVFSSSHIWMWELDLKESWVLKNWCFWTVVLEKILENPLDCKEIKPVNPKGNQPWIFIGMTDAEAPMVWSSDVRSQFIIKDPDAEKDWRLEEKGNRGWNRLDGITDSKYMSLRKLKEMVKYKGAWHAAVHGVSKSQTQLNSNNKEFISALLSPTSFIYLASSIQLTQSNLEDNYCQWW